MIMYQTHCQRILDTVVRANFEEVSELFFFVHLSRLLDKIPFSA